MYIRHKLTVFYSIYSHCLRRGFMYSSCKNFTIYYLQQLYKYSTTKREGIINFVIIFICYLNGSLVMQKSSSYVNEKKKMPLPSLLLHREITYPSRERIVLAPILTPLSFSFWCSYSRYRERWPFKKDQTRLWTVKILIIRVCRDSLGEAIVILQQEFFMARLFLYLVVQRCVIIQYLLLLLRILVETYLTIFW